MVGCHDEKCLSRMCTCEKPLSDISKRRLAFIYLASISVSATRTVRICYTWKQTVYLEPKHVFSSCSVRCCMFMHGTLGLGSTLNHRPWAGTGKCSYFNRSFQPVSGFPLFLHQHFSQCEMWKHSKYIYWPNPILHSSCQPWLIKWIPSQERVLFYHLYRTS